MAGAIANDRKVIRGRMQQIKLEESALPCARCGGRGWVPAYEGDAYAVYDTVRICDVCRNPNDLLPP
jgi:hypothetical protein